MKELLESIDSLTIHGLRHIFRSNKVSKIFWVLTFLASLCGLAYYGTNSHVRLTLSPDISIRINHQFIRKVPIPAITICTPVFAKNNLAHYYNFMDDLKTLRKDVKLNLTVEEQNYFASNIQTCDPKSVDLISKNTMNRSENNTVKLLNSSFLSTEEIFVQCSYRNYKNNSTKMFNRILTDKGFCYTFNLQGFNTIFNEKIISEDFHCFKRFEISRSMFRNNKLSNETVNDEMDLVSWSPDKGYSINHEADSVPVKGKRGTIFSPVMYLKEIDASNICSSVGNIFSFYLHQPNEIPMTYWHLEQHVEFRRKKDLTLTITSYRADEGMRKFSPKSRGCYFEGERPLKFFKSYTKAHCEFECMTNYTLKVCGCVKFSMPRTSKTPVCTVDKASCYFSAMDKWPDFKNYGDRLEAICGCLKACSEIKYGIKLEKNSALDNVSAIFDTHSIAKGDAVSRLNFILDDFEILEYEEYAVYGLHNFIADVGGLLGLFLGCSVLSLIEIVYFLYEACRSACRKSHKPTVGIIIHKNYNLHHKSSNNINKSMSNSEFLKTLLKISNDTYVDPHPLYETA